MRVNTVIFVLQMFRVPASERSDNLSERQAGIQSCPLRRGLWTQAVSGAGQQIQNTTCTAHRANSCTVWERLHAFCLLANHVFTVHHAMTCLLSPVWVVTLILVKYFQNGLSLRTFTVYEMCWCVFICSCWTEMTITKMRLSLPTPGAHYTSLWVCLSSTLHT